MAITELDKHITNVNARPLIRGEIDMALVINLRTVYGEFKDALAANNNLIGNDVVAPIIAYINAFSPFEIPNGQTIANLIEADFCSFNEKNYLFSEQFTELIKNNDTLVHTTIRPTYKNFISLLYSWIFRTLDNDNNNSVDSMFWNGVSIDIWNELTLTQKYFLQEMGCVMALYDKNNVTYCCPIKKAQEEQYCITRICYQPYKYDNFKTMFEFFNDVVKKYNATKIQSIPTTYTNTIGLTYTGNDVFCSIIAEPTCESPIHVLNAYATTNQRHSGQDMFDTNSEYKIIILSKILSKLGFLTRVGKNTIGNNIRYSLTCDKQFNVNTLLEKITAIHPGIIKEYVMALIGTCSPLLHFISYHLSNGHVLKGGKCELTIKIPEFKILPHVPVYDTMFELSTYYPFKNEIDTCVEKVITCGVTPENILEYMPSSVKHKLEFNNKLDIDKISIDNILAGDFQTIIDDMVNNTNTNNISPEQILGFIQLYSRGIPQTNLNTFNKL